MRIKGLGNWFFTAHHIVTYDRFRILALNDSLSLKEVLRSDNAISIVDVGKNELYLIRDNKLCILNFINNEISNSAVIVSSTLKRRFHFVRNGFYYEAIFKDNDEGSILNKCNLFSELCLKSESSYDVDYYAEIVNEKIVCRGNLNKGRLLVFNSKVSLVWEKNFGNECEYKDDDKEINGYIEQIAIKSTGLFLGIRGFNMQCLDLNNGAVIWRQKFLRPIVKFEIDEAAGKIYVYNKITHFYVLEINSGEILFSKEIRNTWRNQGFDPWLSGFTIDSDYIYATGSDIRKIAVIDKSTLDVVQTIDIENTEKIPEGYKPQIIGEYIYQLDGENTLHIFDKKTMAYLSK